MKSHWNPMKPHKIRRCWCLTWPKKGHTFSVEPGNRPSLWLCSLVPWPGRSPQQWGFRAGKFKKTAGDNLGFFNKSQIWAYDIFLSFLFNRVQKHFFGGDVVINSGIRPCPQLASVDFFSEKPLAAVGESHTMFRHSYLDDGNMINHVQYGRKWW